MDNKRKCSDDETEINKTQKIDYICEFKPVDYSSNITIFTEDPVSEQDTVGKKVWVTDCSNRFSGTEYQYFGKQDLAFDYIDDRNLNVPVFAQDKRIQVNKNSKGYIAAHYKEAFARISLKYNVMGRDMMKGMSDLIPALYELQRDRKLSNLFFDLEYDYEPNKGVNSMKLLKSFSDDVLEFSKKMGLANEQLSNVETLVLYSKNPSKASFHLHIIFENHLFESEYHVGAFVRNFTMWTIEKYGDPDGGSNPYFLLELKTGEMKFFADLGVYTSNRPFRTTYCAKNYGKFNTTPLLTLSDWKTIEWNPKNVYKIKPELVIFLKSCPQYIEQDGKYNLIKMKNPDGSVPLSTSYTKFWRNGGSMSTGFGSYSGGFTKIGNANEPIVRVCMDIVREKLPSTSLYFVSHSKEEQFVVVGTYSRECPIREFQTGIKSHKSNHVHYIVHYLKMKMRIKCKDSDCQVKNPFYLHIHDKWTPTIYKELDPSEIFIDESQTIKSMNMLCDFLRNSNNVGSPVIQPQQDIPLTDSTTTMDDLIT